MRSIVAILPARGPGRINRRGASSAVMPNPYRLLATVILAGACLLPAGVAAPAQAGGTTQPAGTQV